MKNLLPILALILCLIFPVRQASAAITPLNFMVSLSEAVIVDTTGGTPRVELNVGGVTRYAAYASGSGTSALVFSYTPVAGDVDLDGITLVSPLDLNSGSIKDVAGNNAALTFTLPNTANIRIDYPSLSMDFTNGSSGRYTLNGAVYTTLSSFLTASGSTFSRASIATYYDLAGVLQTASSGTPRFDHDPVTLTPKGILIEESRTNVLQWAEEIDNAAWLKSHTTVTPNTSIAPNGNMQADCVATNGTGLSYLRAPASPAASYTSGQSVTRSIYAKAGTSSIVIFETFGTGTTSFNLSTLTASQSGGGSASISNIGNGWYRLASTRTYASSGTESGVIYIDTYGTAPAGRSVCLWGAQTEIGPSPTSYIPTTSVAVTRQRDILSIPAGAWFSNTTGAFFADFFAQESIPQNTYTRIVGSGTDATSFIGTGGSLAQMQSWNGGVTINASISPSVSLNTSARGVITWNETLLERAISVNGNNAVSNTYTGSYNKASFQIGGSSGQSNPPNAAIRNIKYYPLRISNTQLGLLSQ